MQKERTNEMKKLIGIIGLTAVLALSVSAQTPLYSPQTLTSTATIASATATNIAAVMDVRKMKNVAVQITAYGDTGVAGNVAVFTYSVDGSTYSTANGGFNKTVAFTPTTTGRTIITNLDTWGCGYMKLAYVTNDTGASVTNLVIKYGVKISVP